MGEVIELETRRRIRTLADYDDAIEQAIDALREASIALEVAQANKDRFLLSRI